MQRITIPTCELPIPVLRTITPFNLTKVVTTMPFRLGGYVLDFQAIRRVMAKFEIPHKGVNDERLEWPINDWLAKTGNLHILAAAVVAPETESNVENSIMIISTFQFHEDPDTVEVGQPKPEPEPLVESERDWKVKKWLMEGGAQEAELQWAVIWDHYGITRRGIQPQENTQRGRMTFVHVTHEEMLATMKDPREEFKKSGKKSPFW